MYITTPVIRKPQIKEVPLLHRVRKEGEGVGGGGGREGGGREVEEGGRGEGREGDTYNQGSSPLV